MTEMNPVEGDVKRKVKRMLRDRGYFTFMPPANTYGANGISDHLAIKGGVFLAVEAKLNTSKGGTKERPCGTPNQEEFMKNIRDHGGHAMVVNAYNFDKFETMLDWIDDYIKART